MAAGEWAGCSGGRPSGFPGVPLPSRAARREGFSNAGKRKLRLPYRFLGPIRTVALHDQIVSRRIEKLAKQIDIIHLWPLGALETLKTAARLGIPTVLERCNAHTGFAMEVVRRECERLGVTLPLNHEHAYNAEKLRKEEEEYHLATRLLCPCEFVVKTFIDKGYPQGQLARHFYGYDETVYYPDNTVRDPKRGLTMLFVGVCAVRKGVHYALEAWLKSPACEEGTFLHRWRVSAGIRAKTIAHVETP